MTDAQSELTGKLLGGRYRIGKQLGTGGMGAVYEGENLRIRRRVAIKLVNPTSEGA